MTSEYVASRQLIQQAEAILIHERGFSADEAHRCLYELALADRLFITEIADRIVNGQWFGEQGAQNQALPYRQMLGCW